MPEVERPKALHGRKANRAFISQECDGDFRGIVWGEGDSANAKPYKHTGAHPANKRV